MVVRQVTAQYSTACIYHSIYVDSLQNTFFAFVEVLATARHRSGDHEPEI